MVSQEVENIVMKDNSESRPLKATPSKRSCKRLQKSLEKKVMESFLGVQSSHSKDRPKDKQPSQPNRRDGSITEIRQCFS